MELSTKCVNPPCKNWKVMNCQMKPCFNPSRLNAPYFRNQVSDRLPSLYSRKKTNTLNTKRTIVIDQLVGELSLLMYWRSASIAIDTTHRAVFFQRAFQIFTPFSPLFQSFLIRRPWFRQRPIVCSL